MSRYKGPAYIESFGTDEQRRDAYLSLADEFDMMGQTTPPELDWFEPDFVRAAAQYAQEHGIPLAHTLGSFGIALEYVEAAKRREASF